MEEGIVRRNENHIGTLQKIHRNQPSLDELLFLCRVFILPPPPNKAIVLNSLIPLFTEKLNFPFIFFASQSLWDSLNFHIHLWARKSPMCPVYTCKTWCFFHHSTLLIQIRIFTHIKTTCIHIHRLKKKERYQYNFCWMC